MGWGNIKPGGKDDLFFGGRSAYKAEQGLQNAQKWEAEQEANRQRLLGQNDVKWGFGSTVDAFRNRQRINNQGNQVGQNVFNAGVNSASANMSNSTANVRGFGAESGTSTSSFAQQQNFEALNRYNNSIGKTVAMQDTAINDYAQTMEATRQADRDVIRNNQVSDLRQQYIDKANLQAYRDSAVVRGFMNHNSDIQAGFGGGGK